MPPERRKPKDETHDSAEPAERPRPSIEERLYKPGSLDEMLAVSLQIGLRHPSSQERFKSMSSFVAQAIAAAATAGHEDDAKTWYKALVQIRHPRVSASPSISGGFPVMVISDSLSDEKNVTMVPIETGWKRTADDIYERLFGEAIVELYILAFQVAEKLASWGILRKKARGRTFTGIVQEEADDSEPSV